MSTGKDAIPRPIRILVGHSVIGEEFKVGKKTLIAWEDEGAPIVRDERNVARAEAAELWAWYRGRNHQSA
ncbi:hypothetical protein dsx2_2626 [Desulfovibrio sp. X2]|uniref:hypothetical protein n=1 Tax=Desulfovibrio sp. X2 TaxID=941449 RepID=UPI0003588CC4|nr:hypothetical protein [Desulfovibrio sp. X2]EPR42709.1 hypothetical protein dsx2_2626 [Desulfovibrio sp. X2]